MFSFFHKKKHSPEDSPEGSLASSQRPEDEFEIVNPAPGGGNSGSLYPTVGPSNFPYPLPPASTATATGDTTKKEVSFLQGVPFSLSKELIASDNSELISIQVSEIMAFITRKLQVEPMDYDFSIEKSVLLENCS